MLVIHDYGAQHEKLTPAQVAKNQNHWKQGLYLVFQMERTLQTLKYFPLKKAHPM